LAFRPPKQGALRGLEAAGVELDEDLLGQAVDRLEREAEACGELGRVAVRNQPIRVAATTGRRSRRCALSPRTPYTTDVRIIL
jgi:hypothetical protein